MRRWIVVTALFSIISISSFSQTGRKITANEKQLFEQRMGEQLQQVKTLQCTFVQEKTSSIVIDKAVSKGILMYQSPSLLRWEYSDPTPSTLILNGNNAILLDKNGERIGNQNMLSQLGSLVISMINGSSFMHQNKQFSSEMYETNHAEILVVLTPIQRRLKDFYQKIELNIDPKTMLANDITLYEKTGDKMVIILTNKALNSEIPQNKFAIK